MITDMNHFAHDTSSVIEACIQRARCLVELSAYLEDKGALTFETSEAIYKINMELVQIKEGEV